MKKLWPYLSHLSLGIAAGYILLGFAGCFGNPPPKPVFEPVPFPSPPEAAKFYYERTVYGTGAVEAVSEEDRLKEILTGVSKKAGMGFAKPFDVAVHQGRVFVSDTVLRVVVALDFPQQKSFQIGDKGDEGDLGKPLGIAVDGQGNLYVVDIRLKRVAVYNRNGKYLRAFGGRDTLVRPSGIDVSLDGSRAYVVDVGGVKNDSHRILVFDPLSGELIQTIGGRGKEPGQFNLPRDVAIGPNNLLYVSDGGNFRVQAMDTEGKFQRTWGKAGMRFGQFSRPKGIATDPKGNVYVIDAAFGNFQIFNPDGELLMFVGRRSEKNGPAVFMLPAGIDIDEDGRIYVIDQFFRKLEILRPAGLPPDQGFLTHKTRPQ